jgi:septation ring formation regulator EzrA
MKNINDQLTTLKDQISLSINNINNLQTDIINKIEDKVEINFNSMYATFEDKIESTILEKVRDYESSTDKKLETLHLEQVHFRGEHKQFVEEHRESQSKLQLQTEAIMALLSGANSSHKKSQSGRVTRLANKINTEVNHTDDGINSVSDMNE